MAQSAPCAIVIFGASGDLAKRKLIPAIYELMREGLLNDRSYVVGFSRSEVPDEQFRAECREGINKFARSKPINDELWKKLESRIYYCAADYGSTEDHARVDAKLKQLDQKHGCPGNRLYYLSTPPNTFEPIIKALGEIAKGSSESRPYYGGGDEDTWKRLIIEKPFGRDLASAQNLNNLIHRSFKEDQVFRIDHYLGKETVQNLMVMRFANSIFEPIWNYKYIDHVQITVAETVVIGGRAGYYNASGATRDMIQNHIFQVMALVAMEPPSALDAVSIRDEKVKVFRSVRPIHPSQVEHMTARGQYGPGEVAGTKTGGYLKEKDVPANSTTETFSALKLYIDNWRWSGTPFYIRTGKGLHQKISEATIRFRSPPLTLFQKQCETSVFPNDLVIRIQPNEGISWRLNGKVPGGHMNIKPVALDFNYSSAFNVEPPEAYERLIHDAIIGDQTLFIRGDEAEAAWSVIDPIEKAWAESKTKPEEYAPGSWGPKKAFKLIEDDGRRWTYTGDQPDPILACSL